MEISNKTDYAIRMLAELVRSDGSVVSVRHAAEKNGVPYSFARSIQHDLVVAGIIESVRGSHGGMRLAIEPRDVTLREVVEAIQGPIHVQTCDVIAPDKGPCLLKPECNFNAIWCEAERLLQDYFDAITLYEVVIEGKCPMPVHGHEFEARAPEADA